MSAAGPIVLVHGAWLGDWCWIPVEAVLRAARRQVHVVALTGFGSKRHQNTPDVTLADHVADIVSLIEAYDLDDVTLAGHSYGGRVVTQALGQIGGRVRSVVYLDAHAPIGQDPGVPESWHELAAANGGMLPFHGYELDADELGGDERVRWFAERLLPIPLACFTAPWWAPVPDGIRPTFVLATRNRPSRFEDYAAASRADPAWAYAEVDAGHFLMWSRPRDVAELLLDA